MRARRVRGAGAPTRTAPATRVADRSPVAERKARTTSTSARAEDRYVSLSSIVSAGEVSSHTRRAVRAHKQEQTLTSAAETTPVASKDVSAAEQAADRSTQDRVHAWYRAHPADAIAAVLPKAGAESPVETATKSALLGSAAPVPALPTLPKAESKPEALPVVHKTSAADIAHEQQQQRTAAQKETAASGTRTTADDDAAFAEASNIPSTAPTEREPLPFVHGDFPAGPPVAVQRTPVAARPKAPAIVRIDPRGDAEVLAAANSRPGALPQLTVKDIAPSLAGRPTAATQSTTPAVSSIAAAGKRPKLDAAIAGGMPSSALQDADASAVTPAAAQAVRAAHGDLPAAKPAVLSGDTVALTGGPAVNVNLYDGDGKLILLPPMKGSHEILVHQNQMAIGDGLDRVENDRQLNEMRQLKLLVALPDTDAVYPNDVLPLNRRYARPWAVRFLNDLGQAHYQRFHTSLIVTSAVRTVAFQRHLVLVNGNAAPPTGDIASPHLYGQAIDIAKRGMTVAEIAWMRSYLTPVESAGRIDVEEEFQQACFHISVYRRYLGLPTPRNTQDPAPPQRTLQLARAEKPASALRPMQRARAVLSRHHRIPTALLATGLR